MNVVVVCHVGQASYNVLRALAALGVRVYLVTDESSASVRFSRGCRVLSHGPTLADNAAIVGRINAIHAKVGIASVIPTDVTAALFLNGIRDQLDPAIFPIPSADSLRQLDDKWEFAKICGLLDLDIPTTTHFETNATVDVELLANFTYPLIVKPTHGFGQQGVVILEDAAAVEAFRTQHTHDEGMVIQEFVSGQDWSISVFAMDGTIHHWTAWECPSQLDTNYGRTRFLVTKFRENKRLSAMVRTLITATNFSGVANFDARLSDDGHMMLLECNPRFFHRMLAVRISGGLNFVAVGLPNQRQQRYSLSVGSYYPWQLMLTLRGLRLLWIGEWRWRHLLRDLSEMVCDPLPLLFRKILDKHPAG